MELLLIRHADALNVGEEGIISDAERPLSKKGQKEVLRLAQAIISKDAVPQLFLTSPLVRARETANGLATALNQRDDVIQICDSLAPGGDSDSLFSTVQDAGVERVALVGHEPDMSDHLAWLIGADSSRLRFGKGAVALIETSRPVSQRSGVLRALVTQGWIK